MNRIVIFLIFFITACGGGGGGGGGDTAPPPTPTPAPIVNLSASPTEQLVSGEVNLTWSSSNASSCSASGDWSEAKSTSGSEVVTVAKAGTNTYLLTCSGSGGNGSASATIIGYRNTDGIVVDGYISGADVFIDENANYIADGSENATTSDNEGKFTIRYANGNLVSLGGTDLDSQTLLDNLLITHKLTGHSEFKAVTPVTSVEAFMEVGANINNALGIDSSIDISVTDPVANKGDGGIYDFLYEKGNQLTVLAFALQNITNDLNTTTETTQDYFKAIAEEVEKEFSETSVRVDIETENFINKTLENVIAAKGVTIDEAAKDNTVKALSGMLPIIEVKASDDLTTSVIRFAISTLQNDIVSIANDSAAEELKSRLTEDILNYIADDQQINSDDITPDITAIDDSITTAEDTPVNVQVIANDSYITTAPISVSATNGDNGTAEVAESSPEQITYTPNKHYNGTDTFSYTITQGDKVSMADVNVTINPVNDEPSIDIASTIRVAENQTAVTTVTISDVDGDDLILSLGGTDADSFNLSSTNVLTFKEAPDYETKNSYSIELSLTDEEATLDKTITVLVTNVNDVAPEFTSEATFSAEENQTAIGAVTATDLDGDDVTFSVSGTELSMTSVGVLTFTTAPDYETKTSYSATVTASDGINITTQDITVNVTNVNDVAPEFTSEATFSAEENQTAIGAVTATDAEGDDVSFSLSNEEIAITESGILVFVNPPDYETKTSYSATVTASDGINITTQDITVNVTNVNDVAPEFTSEATFSAEENQTAIGAVTATDAEGDAISITVSGNELDINSEGILSFVSSPDYETKSLYTATLTASDGLNITEQKIVINIINLNDNAPIFSSSSSYNALENQISIGVIEVFDADGDGISFSVEEENFSIDQNGLIAFKNAPDFETDKSFSASINIFDGLYTKTQTINIQILDENDNAPVINSYKFSPLENTSYVGVIDVTDVDTVNAPFNFSISGDDSSSFIVDSTTGELNLSSSSDFETKSTYRFVANVNDGVNTSSKVIEVNIDNILEDIIDYSFNITDGTDTEAPILNVSMTLDELANAKKVYSQLIFYPRVAGNPYGCNGTAPVSEMTKIAPSKWSLIKNLNSQISDQCAYGIRFFFDLHGAEETSPPTPGTHLASGNKTMQINDLQYSAIYAPRIKDEDLLTIINPRADNDISSVNISGNDYTFFYYSPSGEYPVTCEVIDLPLDDGTRSPNVAIPSESCSRALSEAYLSNVDSGFISYEFWIYALEPIKTAYGYIYFPPKDRDNTFHPRNDLGGLGSWELEVQYAEILGSDRRFAKFNFQLDRSSAYKLDFQWGTEYPILFYTILTSLSGLEIGTGDNINFKRIISDEFSDSSAPYIKDLNIKDYIDPTNPQRDFLQFDVEVGNESLDGTDVKSSIRDLWFSGLGPDCNSFIFYIRDDLDGQIDPDTSTISATIPILKQLHGTYQITSAVINDHGFAETWYGNDSYLINTTNPMLAGRKFSVGDGNVPSCPLFDYGYYNINSSINVDENDMSIGEFSATGSSSDTIVYSLATFEEIGETTTEYSDLYEKVSIDQEGNLSYISPPDADKLDDFDEGRVYIVATSTLDPNKSRNMFVNVFLNNDNDEYPVIAESEFNFNENNSDPIGCISFYDRDWVSEFNRENNDPVCGYEGQYGEYEFLVDGDNLLIDNRGILYFINPPDYEEKTSYSGTVSINDGENTTTQTITININDLNDNAPIFFSSQSYSVNENQSSAGLIEIYDPDTVNSFSLGLDDDFADSSLFSINNNGALSFIGNPDYETKNTYDLRVIIFDGVFEVSQDITILINNVIAEAIPSQENLKILPLPVFNNVIEAQLQSSVLEGRQATFSIEEGSKYGILNLDENTGKITYTTQYREVAQENIVFRVSDGVVNDGVASFIINLNTDPLYKHQWHLNNTGQTNFASNPGKTGEDLKSVNSTINGLTGEGVIVSVMDEGLEIMHEDLYENIVPNKSYNFIDGSFDPTNIYANDGDHGTSVAGIIASKGWNNVGGRGVAPNAGLVGYNILYNFSNYNEAWSWGLDNDLASDIDIFNMSYGLRLYNNDESTFNFPTFNTPNDFELAGLVYGTSNLREGKGGIYVKSMGNGFRDNATNGYSCGEEGVDDDGQMGCSIRFHDATHTLPYIIGVAALGADGEKSSYSTTDPSVWVSGFGGEYGVNEDFFGSGYANHIYDPAITTTDQSSCYLGYSGIYGRQYNEFNYPFTAYDSGNENCNYVSTFNGTSSAAPSVAGAIAVLLEAYPNLTWRDVKHIIAQSSRIVDANRKYTRNGISQHEWVTNGAGFNFHPWYGFGAFDIENALLVASSFIANSKDEFTDYGWISSVSESGESLNLLIPSLAAVENTITYSVSTNSNFVEFVQIKISLDKDIPRDIGLSLISPMGTEMNILQPFTNVEGNPNGDWFIIAASGFFGEVISGDWTLKIVDYTGAEVGEVADEGILIDWSLKVYGN